jgi:hypothetical protein
VVTSQRKQRKVECAHAVASAANRWRRAGHLPQWTPAQDTARRRSAREPVCEVILVFVLTSASKTALQSAALARQLHKMSDPSARKMSLLLSAPYSCEKIAFTLLFLIAPCASEVSRQGVL